jgi:hypothetical protein
VRRASGASREARCAHIYAAARCARGLRRPRRRSRRRPPPNPPRPHFAPPRSRARTDTPINAVRVTVVVETADLAHAEAALAALESHGYEVEAPPLRPAHAKKRADESTQAGSSAFVE